MLRKLILAGAFAAVSATAAAAQPPRDAPPPRRLPAPAEIARAGNALDRVLDALMDVRIGPVVDAIDPGARYDRYRPETVGDLASRDDPWARQRLHAEVGRTTAGMAAATREVAVLAPVLARELAEASRRIEDAVHGAPYDAPPR
jgi:serine/threonine protein kinase HipA of HipAB toxin-antitoxin module